MGPYGFCLALGLTGLAVMAFLGFAHHGPGNGHGGVHHGHAGGHGGGVGHDGSAGAVQRTAELEATQIAQARADAERVKIQALAEAEAEAIKIRTVATANAEAIGKVNEAIRQGGENYFKYRQIEMLPEIVPMIAEALSKAKLVTISGADGGGAANGMANNITSVIQTVLAAQLVTKGGLLGDPEPKP